MNVKHLHRISLLTAALVLAAATARAAVTDPVTNFVTRQGDKLMAGGREFRFLGLDAPNVQQNESQIRPDRANRFPDEFEIRDTLGAIQRMGGLATRTFSLSIASPADKGMPVYVTGRTNYNEEAFRCLDRVIALAHEYNVRLIIPFIASQSFGGIRGVDEFSVLCGQPPGSFWTNAEVKADFKRLLNYIVNRTNTVNGLQYKNDPAILCWQLGNEFGSYPGDRHLDYKEWSPRIESWSLEMAAYLKQIDPHHLILDGGGVDRKAVLADPNIDVVSDHYYEYWSKLGGGSGDLASMARKSWAGCRGRKPLMIDEFGLGTTENVEALMETIRESGICGGLLWSVRSHRRDGGWYYHNEGGTPINSFHVPGFPAGYTYDEMRQLDVLRREAFAIRGLEVPAPSAPAPAPVLMPKGGGFTWRGSTGAESYTLERADDPSGPWQVIATTLVDSVIVDVKNFEDSPPAAEALVLYHDEFQEPGKTNYYRVKAVNIAGATDYSNVVGVRTPAANTAGTTGKPSLTASAPAGNAAN
ncbi:MAG: hypothetical protein U1F98_07775 [Verrucomicrobiota bacterium]